MPPLDSLVVFDFKFITGTFDDDFIVLLLIADVELNFTCRFYFSVILLEF